MAIIQSLPLGGSEDTSGFVKLVGNQTVEGVKDFTDGIVSKVSYNTPETSLGVDYYYGFNINDDKIRFYGKGETNGNCACISTLNSDGSDSSRLEVCSSGNDNSITWNGLVKNNVIPFQNDYFNLGSTSNKWKNLYVTSINGKTPAYIDDIPSLAEYSTKSYVDTKVADLVNSAPETLDTLNELASALGNDPNFATTVSEQIGSKANANHTHDDRYYTESEIDTKLGGKSDTSHTHDDRYYTESEIDTKLSSKSDTTHNHNSVYLGISAKAESSKSADSVAWNNVSGKPTSFTPSSHNHDDRYYTETEVNNLLGGKSDTTHNHNSTYLGISAKAESSKSADSVAWNNVSGKPSTYTPSSHTHDDRYYTESEIDTKLNGKANSSHDHSRYGLFFNDICADTNTGWYESTYTGKNDNGKNHLYINAYFGIHFHTTGSFDINGNAIIHSGNIGSQSVNYANSAGAVAWGNVSSRPTKVSQFTNDSGYITGITKAMVTNALGYTPPTSDTNTTYSAGTNMSLSGTTFATSSTPSFSNVTVTNNSSNGLLFGSYRVYVG